MLFLYILLTFVYLVGGARNDCGEIPPALWCMNKHLAAECGFHELCNRYEEEMNNKTLKITLLYESLCPDCQEYIAGPLFDVYTAFKDYIELELIPYGNAKRDPKTDQLTCQHGPEECVLNKFQNCAVHFLDRSFEFVYCFENSLSKGFKLEAAAKVCFAYLETDTKTIDMIGHCFQGSQGNKFQLESAKRTEAAYPEKHKYVPWLYFNDISIGKAQSLQSSLPAAICEWFVGQNAPPSCQQNQNTLQHCNKSP
uniref:Saposin A-type domain-containing protein n=1 Tax=Rhabditophanes sp. KR3021 TaxID=114890 RepID=A0AC35UFB0_9BILA